MSDDCDFGDCDCSDCDCDCSDCDCNCGDCKHDCCDCQCCDCHCDCCNCCYGGDDSGGGCEVSICCWLWYDGDCYRTNQMTSHRRSQARRYAVQSLATNNSAQQNGQRHPTAPTQSDVVVKQPSPAPEEVAPAEAPPPSYDEAVKVQP